MDLSPILNSLNEAQRLAVTAPVGPVLVLAGAGSGKTRVLTHRIAWLIQTEGISPHGVLAVTFTNKAAAQMRGRIEQLLGVPGGALWLGTFHGIAHRLLRAHWREAALVQSFQILDAEDQLRPIDTVVAFGWRSRMLLRGVPPGLRGELSDITQETDPETVNWTVREHVDLQ